MNGQVADGASAGDQDQYGDEGRHAPQGDHPRRRSGIVPDPAPPEEAGHTPRLVGWSRVRTLNRVLPVCSRIRSLAGAEVEAGWYRRAHRTVTALLAGLAPFDVLRGQITLRRAQRRQPPIPVSEQSVEYRAGLPSHTRDQANDIGCLVRTVPRSVRHINRQIVRRMLPVRFHPESESGTAYAEFVGHLSDWPGEINHHLGGFVFKFRRIPFRIIAPRHLIPPFPT
jgi:hypothetical protein